MEELEACAETPMEIQMEEHHHSSAGHGSAGPTSAAEHVEAAGGSAHHAWISQVALSSALLAALAAVTALLANHHSDEAMIEQIRASDQWGYYQAKGVKAAVLGSKVELLLALNKPVPSKDQDKLARYKKEQDEVSEQASELEKSSAQHLSHHVILARGVTMFQVAIAIAAIAVLTRRRRFWYAGLAFGAAGLVFLVQGLV